MEGLAATTIAEDASLKVGSRSTSEREGTEVIVPAAGHKRARTSQHNLYDDIEEIMFGFGDCWPPDPDSVQLMEKMAVQYMRELCLRAMQVASVTGGKLDKECFLFQVRKDSRKFNRAQALLTANKELKRVQKLELATKDDTKAFEAPHNA